MNKGTKRVVNDIGNYYLSIQIFKPNILLIIIEFDSSLMKHVRYNVTCLLDLPDEMFLLICRYLTPVGVLYSFYTPERAECRLHRIISDYYTKIKLDRITNNGFMYLANLFAYSTIPLRPQSLTLSNEHVTCLIQRYFNDMNINTINSIFTNLRSLTLINCFSVDLDILAKFYLNMTQIEYLHITFRRIRDDMKFRVRERCDATINQFLFNKQISSLHQVIIDVPDGLALHKTLIPNQYLKNIDLVVETVDDLYVLLSGLVPNIEKMIIRLRRSRILSRLRPRSLASYLRLTEFTLLEAGIGFISDDIKSILGYMRVLLKLTLSIRDTSDPTFCHGAKFESILIEYLPNLCQFDYTMTHRIGNETLFQDFIVWPMNGVFYEDENCEWVHIYSLPWPSNKYDNRELPIVKNQCNTSVTSDVTQDEYIKDVMITKPDELFELRTRFRHAFQIRTCLSIDTILTSRISNVILTEQTRITSMNSMIQPFVRHLIVECRLNDEREIYLLARQFPHVEYLKLLFPFEKSSFIRCFQTLFSVDESINANRRLWRKLINVSIEFSNNELNLILDDNDFHRWLIRNTDFKFVSSRFYLNYLNTILSIWF
ncbi:unnamed protein product [Rotaria sp. Silwood2]|nr:unnamed protein product [Rotaria sp. Silwood2]CAF2530213.1 unnamed protein product [Rotaria sp. Silwood2]CAF2942330.1 unnamed protein product [Rotaria sp. Silwood2]CAF3327052.1 unnamed protein product [Rotaria sp. Silwood2]CAF3922828.1 unnamed protein product [Rotaria sp. Silwood2]